MALGIGSMSPCHLHVLRGRGSLGALSAQCTVSLVPLASVPLVSLVSFLGFSWMGRGIGV